MIVFSKELDPKFVLDTDLDLLFSDIADFVNTSKIPSENVEPNSLGYRVLTQPTEFWLSAPFQYPLGGTTGPDADGFYVLDDTIIDYDPGLPQANNRNETNQPVVLAHAYVCAFDAGVLPANADRVRIGCYNSNTASWSSLSSTQRFLGQSCGEVNGIYDAMTQQHYMDNTPGYVPFNHVYDRPILVVAALGGELGNRATANVTKIAVMVSSAGPGLAVSYLRGKFFVCARDNS